MNIDDSSESSSCAVRSKYFNRNCAMDESLSEFQETKKSNTGPKNTAKKVNKHRKAPKRPRGQKDIRTALQSKKNELELYSKDFDKVCKKAGLDVDSEQLQLAIALSKSLQHTTSSSESVGDSQTITTQDRIGKIRTTLQEYGFKVPEVKIAGNTRKNRKPRKNYKLIQTSDVEKKEIIANRYSQILFQNITHCSVYCSDVKAADIPLYDLASNVTYELLRIKDTFYVNKLIEKSTSNGNQLRDWSTIPGRPESPKLFEPMSMNFSEIECSQDELDIILSGSIKRCKVIVNEKIKDWTNSTQCKLVKEDNISIENTNCVNEDIEHLVEPILTINKYRSCSPDMFDDDASDILDDSKYLTPKENSSEVHKRNIDLEVMDLTKPIGEKSQSKLNPTGNRTNRISNEMELTECIHIQANDQCVIDPTSQLSQKINVTKRKSNDFMELTECAPTSSQPVQNNIDLTQSPDIIEENNLRVEPVKKIVKQSMNSNPSESNEIDLTKSLDNNNVDSPNKNTPEEVDGSKNVESMDLTQSSNTSDELPFVSLTATKEKSSDDTIIIDINNYAHINRGTNSQTEVEVHIDLTQNMHSNNDGSKHSQSFFEEYNHDHADSPKVTKENHTGTKANEDKDNRIDLTQSTERVCSKNYSPRKTRGSFKEHSCNSLSQSKYGKHDYIIIEPVPAKVHPSNSPLKNHRKGKPTVSPNLLCDDNPIVDIDLTQKSDTSEGLSQTPKNDCPNSSKVDMEANNEYHVKENDLPAVRNLQGYSSLGKKDDISIDYDDFINTDANKELVYSKSDNPESTVNEIADENIQFCSKSNGFLSNCSQNSVVFEISDKELDYSLHKSKLEMPGDIYDFGGISIMDDISNFGTSKKSKETDTNSIANEVEIECFPEINIGNRKDSNKCNEISPIKHRRITEIATPQKACCSNMVTVTTPTNSELIIKTNNVTPMRDYASMSTPDIHKELDKYGIKPFKRKRAIQLLTHIYNQTHPIIDIADELASPPKRHKPNDDPTSHKKHKSPRKLLTSPRKDSDNCDNNTHISKEKENLILCEEGKKAKGKGKGKTSLKSQKKDAPEITDGSKEIVINEAPIIKEIECSPEDWVFQKREKAKVHSCRVPLHVSFYNYVSSRRELREAILRYHPVEIDLIHNDLVGHGHRYDPKDLLKFLDKKCITVKTSDDARNHK